MLRAVQCRAPARARHRRKQKRGPKGWLHLAQSNMPIAKVKRLGTAQRTAPGLFLGWMEGNRSGMRNDSEHFACVAEEERLIADNRTDRVSLRGWLRAARGGGEQFLVGNRKGCAQCGRHGAGRIEVGLCRQLAQPIKKA